MNEQFGELRSWMQSGSRRFDRAEEFYELLERAQRQDPGVFIEQWLTYLAGFELPGVRLSGLEQLRAARAHLPENTPVDFSLYCSEQRRDFDELVELLDGVWLREVRFSKMSDERVDALVSSGCFRGVEVLNFNFNDISAAALSRLLDDGVIEGLRELELSGIELGADRAEAIATAPGVSSLRSLTLRPSGSLGAGVMRTLAGSERFASLEHFVMEHHLIQGAGVEAMTRSSWFPGLEALCLNSAMIDDRALDALASAPNALRELKLRYHYTGRSRVSEDAVSRFFCSRHYDSLDALALSGHGFDDGVLVGLSRASGMRSLRALNLSRNRLVGGGLDAESLRTSAPALAQLQLNGNALESDGLYELLAGLPSLDGLDVSMNGLDGRGVIRAIDDGVMPELSSLRLCQNRIDSASASALARCSSLRGLRELGLGMTAVGDEGVAALAASPELSSLEVLLLSHCELTDDSARVLARSRLLGELRVLDLNFNQIADAGVRALAKTSVLGGLERLGIAPPLRQDGTQVSARALDALVRCAEGASVEYVMTRYNRTPLYRWPGALER